MEEWRKEVQDRFETILCAAILRKEPRTNCQPYHEGTNQICDLEIGYRHHDIMQRFGDELLKSLYAQGFYTSKGRFVGRHEAMYITYKTNKIPKYIALKNPEKEKTFVDHMNNMILGEIVPESKSSDIILKYQQREEYYEKLGYNQLFSEDLY